MYLPYAYTPQIWPPVFTVLVLIALAVYSFRHRSVPGALPFTIALLLGALWMVGNSLEVMAVDASTKIFWIKFRVAWLVPVTTAVTCFLLEYAWPGRWLTRRNLALLSVPCLLNVVMILTDDLHHLAWQGFALDGEVIPLNGLGNWVFLGYVFVLGLSNLFVLAWLFVRSPQHRWPATLMMTGLTAVRVVYALDAVQVIHSDLPIEVIIFWFQIPMYMIALFGFHILNPIPLARQTVIEQLRDGMLVLDPQGRVASLNPAAERILATTLKRAQGKPIAEILPRLAELHSPLINGTALAEPIEMDVKIGAETRNYELDFSPLNDFRGLSIGRLLLLHDVTEQRRSQAQNLEQQRVLAMLHERERLGRELHDSLGQIFAFVNAQGQTVQRLLSRGDIATANEYTGRMIDVARGADIDIRESILGLRVSLTENGFFSALVQYLAQYEKNYAIHTQLEKPESMQDGAFEPLIEVQLLRILQEALTNVRKHANAGFVQITFAQENHMARVTIQDDGQGFDLGVTPDSSSSHVGLQVMRERAEEVGGRLQIVSNPGGGTSVEVEVPVNSKQ